MNSLVLHVTTIFFGAIIATILLVPKVIRVVKHKQLMERPNARSSHLNATPSLGGAAFYMVFFVSMYFNDIYDTNNISTSLLPGLTILLFLGLKDDLVILSPQMKLFGQIAACGFVLYHYKFEVENFHGFIGIYGINPYIGVAIALLLMLTIINAYNLIDGIDGLASMIGTVSFLSFAILFFYTGRLFLATSAITMCGILIGFLVFNVSKKEELRIFMGDTGSMMIGFLTAVMSIRLLALEPKVLEKLPFEPFYIPIVIFSILLIPLYDTFRVFILRIKVGKSPFSPDRNHLHHILLDYLGLSHRSISLIIATFSILNVFLIFLLIYFTNYWFTCITILVLGVLLTLFLNSLSRSNK